MTGAKTFSYLDDGLLTESEMLRGAGEGSRFVRARAEHSPKIHVEGRPVLHLRAKSDSTATNFVAVLLDCSDAGSCRVVSRAFLEARYRDGLAKGKDLEPGKWYDLEIEFIDKSHVLADDHHFEVLVASSSNTWVAPSESRATNTLDLKGSFLELPVR